MRRVNILTAAFCLTALAGMLVTKAQVAETRGLTTLAVDPGDPPPPIPPMTIAQGEHSGWCADDPGFAGADFLIRDPDAWGAFWAGHCPDPVPPPPVDFERHVVIAALQGFQPSGCGPNISIVDLRLDGPFTQVVIVDDRRPGPCDMITHPFHLVAAPREAFPPQRSVIFKHERPFPEAGTIIGHVFGEPPEDGGPIPLPGAHVMLARDNAEPRHAMTGLDGSYFFVNVEPGEYVMLAEHPDFQPVEQPVFVPPQTLVVRDFFLPPPPPPGAIVGLVLGGNPEGEPFPLDGALAQLFHENHEVERRFTNDDGFFEFEPVPPGEYVLRASHEGFFPQDFPVMVEPGGVVEHVFVLEPAEPPPPPPGALIGCVLGELDGDCVPIDGALVQLFGPDGEVRRAFTNCYGMFVIWDVPPGVYMAVAEAEGWLPAAAEVEIFPAQPTFHAFCLQQP